MKSMPLTALRKTVVSDFGLEVELLPLQCMCKEIMVKNTRKCVSVNKVFLFFKNQGRWIECCCQNFDLKLTNSHFCTYGEMAVFFLQVQNLALLSFSVASISCKRLKFYVLNEKSFRFWKNVPEDSSHYIGHGLNKTHCAMCACGFSLHAY